MKTTNNYEAPVAEMIEMNMPVVLTISGGGGDIPGGDLPGGNNEPPIPMP